MLTINTNLSSLIVQSNLKASTLGLNQAIERMTTGFKINGAKDNAAGYSISTNMSTKIGAYQVAEDNASMGLDMVSTASGSLSQISDKLSRLRALTMQAQNGTYGSTSIDAIRQEADGITAEINRIMSTAEYNGIKLFGESSKPTINGKEVTLNSDGFMVDVTRRDTTGMTSIADVAPYQTISSGTYSISTSDELVQFLEMEDSDKIKGGEFVLANDIDMSGKNVSLAARIISNIIFDGNGYKISNSTQCLFSSLINSEIKNLGLENVRLTDSNNAYSPLATEARNTNITNCYATGCVNGVNAFFGGLVGGLDGGTIDHCWTDVDINGSSAANGGIVGALSGTISNSFSLGNVNNTNDNPNGNLFDYSYSGGIAGMAAGTIENCYTSSKVSSAMGSAYEYVIASNDSQGLVGGPLNLTITNVTYDAGANPGMALYDNSPLITASNVTASSLVIPDITLQVGINSSLSSQITFSTAFTISGLSSDIENPNLLTTLDEIIESVSNKQTELGSVQNRLESVLEEISIQYDNLVSSRSTIRDADIAEESSQYIKMQILQQASATLLATANQTPSIALQLL